MHGDDFSLAPGGTDIERARAMAESGLDPQALSDEELRAGEPRYSLHVGENGLLCYGTRPDIIEVSVDMLHIYQS